MNDKDRESYFKFIQENLIGSLAVEGRTIPETAEKIILAREYMDFLIGTALSVAAMAGMEQDAFVAHISAAIDLSKADSSYNELAKIAAEEFLNGAAEKPLRTGMLS